MLSMAKDPVSTNEDEPWVKEVGKRTMLIPTLELVKASVDAAGQKATVLDLRQTLADQFGTDSTCPVTIRRHLKALGVTVGKGTGRIEPGL
jgi:hypothetical protein